MRANYLLGTNTSLLRGAADPDTLIYHILGRGARW